MLAVAGTQTSQIDLGVGIVPTYPGIRWRWPSRPRRRRPAAAGGSRSASAYRTGRSSRTCTGSRTTSPPRTCGTTSRCSSRCFARAASGYRGTFYRVDGGFTVPGTSPVEVLVGALSPLMVQAAGELADGVVTWLAGPRTLGEDIIPQLHRAAGDRRGRDWCGRGGPPRVVAALPVALTPGTETARRTADEVFARYAGFDNYRRLLEREGASTPGALAVTGTEAGIEKQLRRLADLGVTELWPIIFPVGDDPARSRRETRALLRDLATAEPGASAGHSADD